MEPFIGLIVPQVGYILPLRVKGLLNMINDELFNNMVSIIHSILHVKILIIIEKC